MGRKKIRKTGWIGTCLALFLFAGSMPARPAVLSWEFDNDPHIRGFIVYFGRTADAYSDTIDVGRADSYEIKGLENGIRYFFAVTSYDSCYNESPFSPVLSYIFTDASLSHAAVLAAPRILDVQPIGDDVLLLTFDGALEPAAALDTSHYSVDGNAALATHINSDGNLVLLRFSPFGGGSHTLSVSGILKSDAASNSEAVDTTLSYRIDQSAVADASIMAPMTFGLSQNYPNPFNPETRIPFSVREPGPATVTVHDLMGRRVAVLYDGAIETPGLQKDLTWNGTDDRGSLVASGVYLIRLQQGRRADTRRMQLMR